MNAYANQFYCACNDKRSEVVINFAQEHPIPFRDSGGQPVITTERDEIAGIIMTREAATELARTILLLLEKDTKSAKE